MTSDEENPILERVQEEMDIVPYTRKDRFLNYIIYVVVICNLLSIAAFIVFGGILW